ncbi:hypothetical protein [Flectobacillus roseus]|uniref:hypothetical protein n=1 Tax=Flectobacillus roseus TaxID=502259 RepID=UPI0024B76C7E|nr:hypothetical protein [Flectobacillus roseus]MDI9872645.1 hypothetical protein [Flectobacillus roseus]
MFKAILASNKRGISEIEMNYDNISETRKTINVGYYEKIDISKIADSKKYPDATGFATSPKSWEANQTEFQNWYNQPEILLIEILVTSLGLVATEIQQLDPQTANYSTIKLLNQVEA